jgi:nitroreductase
MGLPDRTVIAPVNTRNPLVPLSSFVELPVDEMRERARAFLKQAQNRRSVRDFSDRPIPRDIIEFCILAAGTAPNGAHRQPWRFVAVSDPEIKRAIRVAAEEEEKAFYEGRAPEDWLEALEPLGTHESKPFLEGAPYLIVVFAESYAVTEGGEKSKNYYVTESVGIATGMLITAIHSVGLVSLTHTPAPMGFLNQILGRPENERAFLILVVGYPAPDAIVPELRRKSLDEIATFIE